MSSIDQVIARSRQPGAFAERKRFTVARQRALQKMRKFALAHPAHYIVELIQAAIANGATYTDIEIESRDVVLSYIGGSFSEAQLGQLFDFLFASKESIELADVRQLALGVNALLLAEPREVVIESGDGTIEGTTRIQIDAKRNSVEVGTPTQVLNGTYVRAAQLNRSVLGHGLQGLMELDVIEQRCLSAPVPIIVNSEPLFGFSSQRIPRLFGFSRQISFDEGDLYGTIGFSASQEGEVRDFKLLTYGVWVESVRESLLESYPLGGLICFDRLHKTADHAAIVRDDLYQEMWARLLPYARQLRSGRTGEATFDISLPGGTRLSTAELRRILKEGGGAVVVPRFDGPAAERRMAMASAFGEALELPVVVRGEEQTSTLRMLAGRKARVIEPDLDDAAELEFYRKPKADPPARPWLTGAVELDPIPTVELAILLEREGYFASDRDQAYRQRLEFLKLIGGEGEIRATVYTPLAAASDADLHVEVRTAERLAWRGGVRCPYPGHVLVIETPELSPKLLVGEAPGDAARLGAEVRLSNAPLAALISAGVARMAIEALSEATGRVLASLEQLETGPESSAARIALAALVRGAFKRLRNDDEGTLGVRFSLLDPDLPEAILEVPLFQSLDGTPRSARDLEALMAETGGLVYGVIPEVRPDLEGLYQPRILTLDLNRERMLIALLGEASYVRVDGRDVLAEHCGLRCRDMALGVRAFADFPLLVEGEADLGSWSDDDRLACELSLVEQLIERYRDQGISEELRRQAIRHLLWYIYFKTTQGQADSIPPVLRQLPLFLGLDGVAFSFDQLLPTLMSDEGLVMHDGWGADVANLGALRQPNESADADVGRGLAMNPFVFNVLSRLGRLRPALEVDLGDEPSDVAEPTYLAKATVDEPFLEGEVGVPTTPVDDPAVLIFDRLTHQVTVLRGPARELGVIGRLRQEHQGQPIDRDQLERLVRRAGLEVHAELVSRVPALAPGSEAYERSLSVILEFAERAISLTAQPDGSVRLEVHIPTAERALDLPLFPTSAGVAVSARRLLTKWLVHRGDGPGSPLAELADETPPLLRRWIEGLLSEERVAYPATYELDEQRTSEVTPLRSGDYQGLARWLTDTLAALRTDPMGRQNPTTVVFAFKASDSDMMLVGGAPIYTMSPDHLHLFCHLGGQPHLVLNAGHWMAERVLSRAETDNEAGLWLLLACYAHINDMLEPVTNDHELDFHRRVFDLIEGRGSLPAGPLPRS